MKLLLYAYILLIIHELLHVIGFLLCGLAIKTLYIFPIRFIGVERVGRCLWGGIFGLVIPDITDLKKEKNLKIRIAFGMILPVLFHFIASIACFIIWSNNKNDRFLNVFAINIIFFLSTLLENEDVCGDLLAFYHILKNDTKGKRLLMEYVVLARLDKN